MSNKKERKAQERRSSKHRNKINHSLNGAYALPEIKEQLDNIVGIQCFFHKISLSSYSHYLPVIEKFSGFIPEKAPPKSHFYKQYRKYHKDGSELILKGIPKNRRQPTRMSLTYSPAKYASYELLSNLADEFSKKCLVPLKVSSVEFGMDIYTTDAYGLFQLFKTYLRVLNPGKNCKTYEESGRNHTLYIGDVVIYMRGEGRVKRKKSHDDKGWMKDECNRLRIEVRAKRGKIASDLFGIDTLDDLLKEAPFLAAFQSGGKFKLRFQVSKYRPTKKGEYPLPGNPWQTSLAEAINNKTVTNCAAHLEDFYPMQKLQDKMVNAIKSFQQEWSQLYNNTPNFKNKIPHTTKDPRDSTPTTNLPPNDQNTSTRIHHSTSSPEKSTKFQEVNNGVNHSTDQDSYNSIDHSTLYGECNTGVNEDMDIINLDQTTGNLGKISTVLFLHCRKAHRLLVKLYSKLHPFRSG